MDRLAKRRIMTGKTLSIFSVPCRNFSFPDDKRANMTEEGGGVNAQRVKNIGGTLARGVARAYCGENSLVSSWDRN